MDGTLVQSVISALGASGLAQLILLILIVASVSIIGRRLLSLLHLEPEPDPWETWLFAAGIGLGALAGTTFLLGILHLLYGAFVKLLFLILAAVSVYLFLQGRDSHGVGRIGSMGWLDRTLAFAVMLCTGIYLLAALAPETGFDALNYHLGVPRLYILHHSIYPTPHIVYSNFPFLGEMLFTWGWLMDSTILAKLFHYLFGLLTAGGMIIFGRRYFSTRAGLLAALIFLSSPIVGFLMQTAYIDLILTFYIFLAVYSTVRWVSASTPPRGWLLLAGLASGLAFSTKYTAVLVLPIITIIAISRVRSARPPRMVSRQLGGFYLAFALIALPWLVKNLVFTGNPVAPLLSNVFYNPNFTPQDYQAWIRTTNNWAGLTGGLLDYVRSPWLLTRYGNIFMGVPGPLFLILFPVAACLGVHNRVIRLLVFISVALYTMQIVCTKFVRYEVPVFPFLSLVIAGSLIVFTTRERRPKKAAYAVSVLIVGIVCVAVAQLPVFSRSWMNSRIQTVNPDKIRLFTSFEERDNYLRNHLGSQGILAVYSCLNEAVPDGDGVLAVTVGYQALANPAIYMTPNSSPASQVSDEFWETSMRTAGIATIRLDVSPSVRSRFWRLRLSAGHLKEPASFYRPRFFFLERGSPMELSLFGLQRRTSNGMLILNADLGDGRRVDRVQFWAANVALPMAGQLVQDLATSRNGRDWTPVPFRLERIFPREGQLQTLVKQLRERRISFLFFRNQPEISFLEDFFRHPDVSAAFEVTRRIGDYRIYRLRDGQ
ncbi:MAG: glycosyltransferase family 39 protein [Acidobacteriota bacterium]